MGEKPSPPKQVATPQQRGYEASRSTRAGGDNKKLLKGAYLHRRGKAATQASGLGGQNQTLG